MCIQVASADCSKDAPDAIYSKRQKAEGRGQKGYYWYVVTKAVRPVLTFMATAINDD
jgi:hypothetical protein